MKKILLSLCVSVTFSGAAFASVIDIDGWDDYNPPIFVASESDIDDDATGKSTITGLVITKPTSDNLDNNIKPIDCDNPRFSLICKQMNIKITDEINEANKTSKSYANYLSSKDNAEMNRLVSSVRGFADDRANQAEKNANEHTDWVRGDLQNYANSAAQDAQNNANNYTDKENDALRGEFMSSNKTDGDDGDNAVTGYRWSFNSNCMRQCGSLSNQRLSLKGVVGKVYTGRICTKDQNNLSGFTENFANYTCKATLEHDGSWWFIK